MPYSEAQRRAAGMALAVKRGETSMSKMKGAAKSMFKSMSESQLKDFAKKKRGFKKYEDYH